MTLIFQKEHISEFVEFVKGRCKTIQQLVSSVSGVSLMDGSVHYSRGFQHPTQIFQSCQASIIKYNVRITIIPGKQIRQVDDYLPRAGTKRQFFENRLQLNDPDSIKRFSNKHIVEENYLKE